MSHLEIRHLSKSFDGREVLKDISLHVEEGEFVTILGLLAVGKARYSI